LVCCGIDFSPDLKYIASGDFSCNIFIWEIGKEHPVKQTMAPMSVRSLTWRKDGTLYCGCLDGHIYAWNPFSEAPIQNVFSVIGGVTSLRWEHGENPTLIAAGTTDGTLAILQQNPGEPQYFIKLAIKAHKPSKEQNMDFGSMIKFAEIWSLAWSPDSKFIATASEDQTTIIWNLYGEQVAVLRGHTTAVTSVSWQNTIIGEIVATCADDKTVRIWKAHTWELIHTFTTEGVEGWHTVTYLALEKGGNRIVAATQNGYVIVWAIDTKEKLAGGKMHTGSVEGLALSQNLVATCSSDLTVNVYDLNRLKG